MSKNKRKTYVKVDLRKVKIANQTQTTSRKLDMNGKRLDQVNFEQSLKKGVIIHADFTGQEFGEVTILKYFNDSKQHELMMKRIDASILSTNGIARWDYSNKESSTKRYSVFYPKEQSTNLIIGESVVVETKDSLVLNVSSMLKRVENLFYLLENVENDEICFVIREKITLLITNYTTSVITKNKFNDRDREYFFELLKDVLSTSELKLFVEKFKYLKREIDKKSCDSKSKHYYCEQDNREKTENM